MAFRQMSETLPNKEIFYNSKESERLLNLYNESKRKSLIPKEVTIPHKRFSPSSIRCKRRNWFKLRGVVPDVNTNPDVTLDFIADIGTHCHESIQRDLKEYLGDDWIDVETYLKENPPEFEYELSKRGDYETQVTVFDPPVSFACDGIIRIDGEYYLLEIKTSEPKSMRRMVGPKQEHLDQVICYCTLLGLKHAIVLYQDRHYGSTKCFTHHITEGENKRILDTFDSVMKAVETRIAPDGLPPGDKWCSPSYCKYYKTCQQWGR